MRKQLSMILCCILLLTGCMAIMEDTSMERYFFPSEEMHHEGTWLIWPHHFTYGIKYRREIEPIWIQMANALHRGENVHIIAYNKKEQERISNLLLEAGLDMKKIDFTIAKNNDVWSRDTGPIFVLDSAGKPCIADFGFNGWGEKTPYHHDDKIPQIVAEEKNLPLLSIPDFILEGGSVELDGNGTAILCKSSVINQNRNPNMSIEEAEAYMTKYLGVTNFIWLDGVEGEDITDAHIDGIAKFLDENTILTVSEQDFFQLYEEISELDYEVLHTAVNTEGKPYQVIELPLTANNVSGLEYKGNYINYYAGNEVVLLPVYQDPNDKIAINIIAGLYPDKEVVGIDVTALYQYGGMIHCVTQQQPEIPKIQLLENGNESNNRLLKKIVS